MVPEVFAGIYNITIITITIIIIYIRYCVNKVSIDQYILSVYAKKTLNNLIYTVVQKSH